MPTRTIFILAVGTLIGSLFAVYAGGSGERTTNDTGAPGADREAQAIAQPRRVRSRPPSGDPPVPSAQLPLNLRGQTPPRGTEREFRTDFSRATISYADILSGGPPKDGIPALDVPTFVSITDASTWIEDNEAVLVVSHDEAAHIYPLQVLTWHEIVNDVVGDLPVAVTYCPLCNTGVAFERQIGEAVLDFGTTGRLRFSNLVMYDRQTESWWQQADGRGVAGFYAGSRLQLYPVLMLPFAEAITAFPHAIVLSRDTGFNRRYGANPYVGYDTSERPFLFQGPEINGAYRPLERVISIENNGAEHAIAYPVLEAAGAINIDIGGDPIAVLWEAGTASALDQATVAGGSDIGSANAFFARDEAGRILTFERRGGRIRDEQTDSVWNITGQAIDGELAGQRLVPATAIQHFWFSYSAFAASNSVFQ